jgi:4-alpha-glucanotransferase
MDIACHDDAACEASLNQLEDYAWKRIAPPVTVMKKGRGREVFVHVADGDPARATLRLEDGTVVELDQMDRPLPPRMVEGRQLGRATFWLPEELPLGWHRIEVLTRGARGRGYVVVTPAKVDVAPRVRAERPWGLSLQLYSLRSERSWGLGDYGDLRDLMAMSKARAGADFVLVNPLHACEPVAPISPSPYLPSSRRFLSPLYIRVEDIDEFAYLPSQARAVIEWEAEVPKRANGTDALLDRDTAWNAKLVALQHIYQAPRSEGREAQFEAFCVREGRALEDYATWCAIVAAHQGEEFPEELKAPWSRAVEQWRDEHADEVLFHAWLQWIADQQLARVQAVAVESDMSVGLMTDLAVGVHPSGADAWALSRVLAQGVSVGAPPDMYNQQGQNWSQPPWQPRSLEAAAYLPFRDVVRAALRHAGALRVDHVLGLFRQWWVPTGHTADDGVYVQFDHRALVGILALEAQRAGAVVIGEDLGTVESWVTDYLNSRGILGTSIVWFEKEHGDQPKPPEHYRADALVSVTTHDLPPNAAYLAGDHVRLRAKLGLLARDLDGLLEEAARERQSIVNLLRERGWLMDDDEEDVIAALNVLARQAPSLLCAVALTDAVGERKTQNQPGTFMEYPNWNVPLCDCNGVPVNLDQLFDMPRVQRLMQAVTAARG